MSLSLPIPAIQAQQVVTIAGVAPGVSGVIAKADARLQGRRGPRIAQPYCDLAKLFRKESLAPEGASWVFLAAPVAAFACYLTVPLLIPVLGCEWSCRCSLSRCWCSRGWPAAGS